MTRKLKNKQGRLLRRRRITGIAFQIPAFILISITMLIPLIWNIGLAFFEWNGNSAMEFIGLDNFRTVLMKSVYYKPFIRTTQLALISVVIGLFLGIGLALAIYRMGKREGAVYRFVIFAPCIIPMTVVGLLFSFVILSPQMGLLNNILRSVGLEDLTHAWLAEPDLVLWVLGVIQGWRLSGTIMILYYTSILSIPRTIFEASMIDGCTYPKQIRHIILPVMKPTLQLSLSLLTIAGFKSYDIVASMTNGGPGAASKIVPLAMLEEGFRNNHFGMAGAFAVLLTLLVTAVLLVGRYVTRGEKYEF